MCHCAQGRCDGTHTAQDHGEKEEEDTHGADVGRNDDDRHPGLADGPKEKTVRTIRLNGLSGIGAIFHAQGDDLIAHTASVFLQIVADNIDDAGLSKTRPSLLTSCGLSTWLYCQRKRPPATISTTMTTRRNQREWIMLNYVKMSVLFISLLPPIGRFDGILLHAFPFSRARA